MMEEKEIERKFVKEIKLMGGKAFKFSPIGYDGMPDRLVLIPGGRVASVELKRPGQKPDRLVLIPGGRIAFVELKRPGQKPRKLQEMRHRMLHRLGFKVYVLDSMEKIGGIIDEIRAI